VPGHRGLAPHDTRVLRGITALVAGACCVLAFALPAVFFALERNHLELTLRFED
jgi:hypothetical protein